MIHNDSLWFICWFNFGKVLENLKGSFWDLFKEAKSSDDENCTDTGFTVTVTQLQNGEQSRSGSPQINDKSNELTINETVQACIVQATIVSHLF